MLLIENGYLIDPKSGREGNYDVEIDDGRITKIGRNLSSEISDRELKKCKRVNAEGLIVAPGLVDVHVHFRDPGFCYKEDIESGAAAAAKGGFTTVVLMANTSPCVDNVKTLEEVLAKGKRCKIHVESCATVTRGMKGEELTDMEELSAKGAAGFTDDGVPIMDEKIVEAAMRKALALDKPISFHEENPAFIVNNGINAGAASAFYGVGGSSREAEISMVARDLELALKTGACVNIQHVSAKETVELIRSAKKKVNNIHAEATPHHFTLTEDAVIKYGTMAKMNPPLREEADREAIIEGLMDGTIDIIATDHAPHSAEEKSKSITEAPSGIIGLETSLPLAVTELAGKGYMTMKQVIALMSTNPASMYHLDAGYLMEGGPADLVLIDTCKVNEAGNYVSKSSNSPFTGWKLRGTVKMTVCGGEIVYEDEE